MSQHGDDRGSNCCRLSGKKRRGAVPRGWEQQPAGCQRSDRAFQRTEGRNRDGRSFMPYRSEFLRPSVMKCGGMNFEYSFWAGAALQGMSNEHAFGVQEGAVRSELSISLCLGCQSSIFLFSGGTWAYWAVLLLPAGVCEINTPSVVVGMEPARPWSGAGQGWKRKASAEADASGLPAKRSLAERQGRSAQCRTAPKRGTDTQQAPGLGALSL
ncbi:uncharacterized protein LOC121107067 isoform X1 [Gallus gallus]|uniref:uncharacterized protein LOC121107067 isoform X1 n=1 Tax=Gallus gallus TaxID=9031 RepID=UPI001AE833BA|nr:uncharacterized protein LOC121107067 isoform X1 [Gallus gallus]